MFWKSKPIKKPAIKEWYLRPSAPLKNLRALKKHYPIGTVFIYLNKQMTVVGYIVDQGVEIVGAGYPPMAVNIYGLVVDYLNTAGEICSKHFSMDEVQALNPQLTQELANDIE